MVKSSKLRFLLLLVGSFILLCSPYLVASPLGHFSGLVKDESGHPVPNLLLALLQRSADQALPILARSDNQGKLHFRDIQAGDYELLVRSSRYRGPDETVEILPGQTTVVTLILQQLLHLDSSDEQNIGVKALLRGTDERRLIFRELPGQSGQGDLGSAAWRPRNAVFEVYSSSGVNGDYLVSPTDSARGMVSNFAVVESLGTEASYVLAGQLNSGEDSLWRLKTFLDYPTSDSHSLKLSIGYSRMSFDQPSMSLLNNPNLLGESPEFTGALGTTKVLTLGFEESFHLSKSLSLLWGLEVNQIQTNRGHTVVNPSAELSYLPTSQTRVRFLAASRRPTQTGSLMLPGGEVISLNDSVYLSKVDNQVGIGTSRYYLSSVSYSVTGATEVELAAFTNRFFGPTTPFLAGFPGKNEMQVLHLNDDQANNHGYRVTVRQRLFDRLTTSVSYIRGVAAGVNPNNTILLLGESSLEGLIGQDSYRAFSTAVEAYFPHSRTHINALVKFVPGGDPIPTLDGFSDTYDTGNQGINLFVRQVVPVPAEFFSLVGLDFLSTYEIEALLDVRNLTNDDLSEIPTTVGNIVLIRNPRSVRGGIAVRF